MSSRIRIAAALAALSLLLIPLPAHGQQAEGTLVRLAGGVNDSSPSNPSSISANGDFVVFVSTDELTPSVTEDGQHTFIYDVSTQTFEQIDVLPNGRSSDVVRESEYRGIEPQVTPDGRFVLFTSPQPDLDPNVPYDGGSAGEPLLYLRDRQSQTTRMISVNADGERFGTGQFTNNAADVSADGNRVAYLADTNPHGLCGSPAALAVYVYDVAQGQHVLASADDDDCIPEARSRSARLNAAGTVVFFSSVASSIRNVASSGNEDIWAVNVESGVAENITAEADADSVDPSVSDDGCYVAFQTETGVYDSADSNFRADIYLRDRTAGTTRLLSGAGPDESITPEISEDAAFVVFRSENEIVGPQEPDTAQDNQNGVYRVAVVGGGTERVDLPADGSMSPSGYGVSAHDVANDGSAIFHTSRRELDGVDQPGFFLLPGSGGTTPPSCGSDEPVDPGQAGAIAESIVTSQARFPDAGSSSGGLHGGSADYAIIATVENFADALSGAVLTREGPLLLTYSDALQGDVLVEINRVLSGSGTVYVLGGEVAVEAAVADALGNAGYTVDRLFGASRFQTSTEIAAKSRELFGDNGEVAIARAFGPENNPTAAWADSVTGGGWAADSGTPIVLTPTSGIHPDTQAFIDADGPSTTHILGGTAALSASFDDLPGARRTAGQTRSDTARQIGLQLWEQPEEGARTYLVLDATIELGWAYGLPAAGAAADLDAPMLAVGSSAPPETLAAVAGCDDQVTLLGVGPVASDVGTELAAADDEACA